MNSTSQYNYKKYACLYVNSLLWKRKQNRNYSIESIKDGGFETPINIQKVILTHNFFYLY